MSIARNRRIAVGSIAGMVAIGALLANACNVPVFRYALDNWRPDVYRVTLLHRGKLTEADRKLIEPILTAQDRARCNVDFGIRELSGELTAEDRELIGDRRESSLALLVAQYPADFRNDKPVDRAPLSDGSVSTLLSSPVRSELVKRLANGQTAVWLLLECGDAAADQTAARLVEDELSSLAKNLKLPELTDAPEDTLLAGPTLRIEFSMLKVRRDDPSEKMLAGMLLGSEPDLAERKAPMLFPVFGRGRAMLPLVGQGITKSNLENSAQFLVGACSCQVKSQNPGFDLLLAADWPALLGAATKNPAPTKAARPVETRTEPELVPIAPGSTKAPEATDTSATNSPAASSPHSRWRLGALPLIAIVGFAAMWVVFRGSGG